jgi:hypothetical protein
LTKVSLCLHPDYFTLSAPFIRYRAVCYRMIAWRHGRSRWRMLGEMLMMRWGCAAATVSVCLALFAVPALAAFECTPQTPIRLCLTMDIRSVAEQSSYSRKSSILSALAVMQAADGRLDLAQETTRLAYAAAYAHSDDVGFIRAAKPAALSDLAAAVADVARILDSGEHAWYLIAVIENLPASADAAAVERLVSEVRRNADTLGAIQGEALAAFAAGRRGPGRFSRNMLYSNLARALAEAGRIDLALAQNIANPRLSPLPAGPGVLVRARLKKGATAEAEELVERLAPADDGLWAQIAAALVKDGEYSIEPNRKAVYAAALALLARHPGAADDRLLTLAKLGAGDFAGALNIASKHVEPSEEWAYTWRNITVALAAAGRVEEAMTAVTRAGDWGTTANAAVASALARAGRRDEAKKFAQAAFEVFLGSDPEFGDRNLPAVAEAFLLADDVPGAIAASGPRCALHLPLTMADDALNQKDRKRAAAILARLDKPLMACIERKPGKTVHSEDPEWDDSAARRFFCQFALLHSRRDTLAKLAAADNGFRRAASDHGRSPLFWDDRLRATTYGCVAVGIAHSENLTAAQAFAGSVPAPGASFEALAALARYAVEEAPHAAAPLIHAVARAGDDDAMRGQALTQVTDALTCLYRDTPAVVPILANARCRAQ